MGLAIRCCIVAAWLALFGIHVWRFVLPGIGLNERHDLGAGLAQQVDRTLTYDIVHPAADGAGRRLGGSELTVVREDAGFRCDLRFELDRLPGATSRTGPMLRISASEKLDDRFRLTGLSAVGEVMGLALDAQATVDHRGLTGTLRIAGREQAIALPGFGREEGAAMDLGVTLPPGLEPGDRFKSRMLEMGMTLVPSEREAVFSVGPRETLLTRGGPLQLLPVVVSTDGRRRSTYWCDGSGTVYRAELGDGSMALELTAVRKGGEPVWPAAVSAP